MLFFTCDSVCSNDATFEQVKVEGSVQNKGWILENVDYKDASVPEELRIRGFRINKIEQLEKNWRSSSLGVLLGSLEGETSSILFIQKRKRKKIGFSSRIDLFVLIFPSVSCYQSIDIISSSFFK